MAKKKHADTIESMELCEGVYLQEEFFEKKENRVLTLLLKGLLSIFFRWEVSVFI